MGCGQLGPLARASRRLATVTASKQLQGSCDSSRSSEPCPPAQDTCLRPAAFVLTACNPARSLCRRHLHAKARAIVPELLLTLQDRTKAVAGGSGGGSSEVWRYRARPPANASKLLHLICLISALDSCNS